MVEYGLDSALPGFIGEPGLGNRIVSAEAKMRNSLLAFVGSIACLCCGAGDCRLEIECAIRCKPG